MVVVHDNLTGFFINKVVKKETSSESFGKRLENTVAVHDVVNLKTFCTAAVLFTDNNFLRNINKTSCQVTGVGGTKSGIGKTLSCTTRGDEVFLYVESFTVVRSDGNLDGLTGCVGDKTAHSGKLTKLAFGTTGTGVEHHIDRIEFVKVRGKSLRNTACAKIPGLDNSLRAVGVAQKSS